MRSIRVCVPRSTFRFVFILDICDHQTHAHKMIQTSVFRYIYFLYYFPLFPTLAMHRSTLPRFVPQIQPDHDTGATGDGAEPAG